MKSTVKSFLQEELINLPFNNISGQCVRMTIFHVQHLQRELWVFTASMDPWNHPTFLPVSWEKYCVPSSWFSFLYLCVRWKIPVHLYFYLFFNCLYNPLFIYLFSFVIGIYFLYLYNFLHKLRYLLLIFLYFKYLSPVC